MFEPSNNTKGRNWKFWLVSAAIGLALIAGLVSILQMTYMPLRSYKGPIPPLSNDQAELKNRLEEHVRFLSGTIGERNLSRRGSLQSAVDYLTTKLQQAGYSVTRHTYQVENQQVSNLEVTIAGSNGASETVVVGAHYDSADSSPGADDNGSGAAAILELARLLQGSRPSKTVRLVLFVNEEPPYFQTNEMGSVVYARQLRREHTPVSAMISLEMIGFYSDVPDSQKYPALLGLFYPRRGNFVGFVGNPESGDLLRRAIRTFRESTKFPSEGVVAPASWPGIGWSDQWSFWQEGYPAIMVTDTALFRYPFYHTPGDTTNRIDFEKMTRVVEGVRRVVESLARE
jgi:Zn-dependent M28 family amino/carboxypeptidase